MTCGPVDQLEDRKIRILEAATHLFAQEGIRAVGVDRLIQHSSVTKATFYKHFGSKDRLIRDYLDSASLRTLHDIDAVIDQAPSPADALEQAAVRMHVQVYELGLTSHTFQTTIHM